MSDPVIDAIHKAYGECDAVDTDHCPFCIAWLHYEELHAERDRLREALEQIVREWEAAPGPVYDQLRKYWLVETMEPAIDAAKAALAKEGQ
jgi:hypothetical protein